METIKDLLAVASVFNPQIKNPVLVLIDLNHIKNGLDGHYRSINQAIEAECVKRFDERGFLFTVTKRKIRTSDYKDVLKESCDDIFLMFDKDTSITFSNSPQFGSIIDKNDIDSYLSFAQGIIDSLELKNGYKIDVEVVT